MYNRKHEHISCEGAAGKVIPLYRVHRCRRKDNGDIPIGKRITHARDRDRDNPHGCLADGSGG